MRPGCVFRMVVAAFFLTAVAISLAGEGRAQTIDEENWSRFLHARVLYVRHCAPCHGHDGPEGLTPYAPGFGLGEGLEREYGMLLLTIQNGVGLMPPWDSVLSYEEQDWILFYSIVLQGDNVFRRHCASCHEGSIPRIPASIPRGDDLAAYDGPIHVDRGPDLARNLDRRELGHVIRMLRALDEER